MHVQDAVAAGAPTPADEQPDARTRLARGLMAPLVFAAAALAALVLLLYLGRGMGFYYDEWNFVLDRQANNADAFLRPHNEHIVVVPVIVYKALFATVGLAHHWPYLLVLVVAHLALGFGVYLLARPRVGGWAAVIVATLVLFMGLAWQNMIWAFQLGFLGSVLGGIWALVALDRGGRRGDVLACVCLIFANSCSSLGVPLALGVGAELLAARRARALWVPAVPLALYALWYLKYGVSTITGEGVVHAAPWALSAAVSAAAAPFGLGANWGVFLLLAFIAGLVWRTTTTPPSPRLVGLLVSAVAFWGLTGAARSVFQPPVSPDQSRYLTFGAVMLLLAAVELVPAISVPSRLLVYGAVLTVLAAALGLPSLRDNAAQIRAVSRETYAELGAMQLVGPATTPPRYQPDPGSPQLFAGPYFAAVRKYGSSAGDTPAQLRADFGNERAAADRVLQELVGRLAPAGAAGPANVAPPGLEDAVGVTATRRGSCDVVRRQTGAPGVVHALVPTRGIVVRALGEADVEVKLRRFGDGFGNPAIGTITPRRPRLVRLPADAVPQPYHVQLTSLGDIELCAVA